MASNTVCASCHCATVITDTSYGHTSLVCETCGFVSEEGSYDYGDQATNTLTSGTTFRGSGLPDQLVRRNSNTRVPRGKLLGIEKVKTISSYLGLSTDVTKRAVNLFERAFHVPSFTHDSMNSKLILAGACVYIICRQDDWPVSLRQMSDVVQCQIHEMCKWKNELTSALGIHVKSTDLLDLVATICDKDLTSLINTVTQLLHLCKDAWLSTGRDHTRMIQAATYVAWQAADFPGRRKVSLRQFCKQQDFKHTNATVVRVREIRELLCKLAKEIPWVTASSVKPELVAVHLEDTLRYQQQLREAIMSNLNIDEEEEEEGIKGENDKEEEGIKGENDEEEGIIAENDIRNEQVTSPVIEKEDTVQCTQQKSKISDRLSVRNVSSSGTKESNKRKSSNYHAGFEPPSFKLAREKSKEKLPNCDNHENDLNRLPRSDLDNPELDEKDIPDSEMGNYLLNVEERQKVAEARVLIYARNKSP